MISPILMMMSPSNVFWDDSLKHFLGWVSQASIRETCAILNTLFDKKNLEKVHVMIWPQGPKIKGLVIKQKSTKYGTSILSFPIEQEIHHSCTLPTIQINIITNRNPCLASYVELPTAYPIKRRECAISQLFKSSLIQTPLSTLILTWSLEF